MLGARTLFDVISLAGGTTPKAGKLISITHRDTPQAPTTVSLSNDSTESIRSNVPIYPGDTIVVSKAGMVYVSGDVHRPSAVPMDNTSMTVLQALAVAEGTNPTANLNKFPAHSHDAEGSAGDSVTPQGHAYFQDSRRPVCRRKISFLFLTARPRVPPDAPWTPLFKPQPD